MKAILTAVLMSASLTSVCGQALPVKAMESMPDVFTKEANDILSKGFCDEVKETGNKLLIPKDYMYENFNDVMYKLVGMEMDYLESVPRKMWDEMVAETTAVIINRCKDILPYGSIIGKWECAQDDSNGASTSMSLSYSTDGKIVQQGIITQANPEDGMVAKTSFKFEGDYAIRLGEFYFIGLTLRDVEMRDISREPNHFSKEILSSLEDYYNGYMGETEKDMFTLFQADRFEQGSFKCDRGPRCPGATDC